ncbi:hypothetical protein FNV58_01090 (plasmid) [Streptomyces sp. RLB1-9]|uniref:hypothetical protein n=1 Tax=Streptomyces sp. RLB1-9 TaxID=2594454 RepID=UPI00116596C0|nr:hypothetical protein [Streptomyces sp. RLB1-9]QDN94956.1 hypothetical protein FNV58_01090 [Streptomyces sp. RLB1-9]
MTRTARRRPGIHAKCLATLDRDGVILICGRSPEHTTNTDPERRKHYDPDEDATWTEERPAPTGVRPEPGKTYATRPVTGRPGWHHVYDRTGALRALAERRPSWWHLYTASEHGAAQGAPVRYETLRDGADAYTRTQERPA